MQNDTDAREEINRRERLRREEENRRLSNLRDVIPPMAKPTKKNIIKNAVKYIKKLKLDERRFSSQMEILLAENRRLELEKEKLGNT